MNNRPSGVTRILTLVTIGSIINLALGFYGFLGDLIFGLPRYHDFLHTSTSGFFPDYIWQGMLLEMSIALSLIAVAFFSLYAVYRLYSAKSWSNSLTLVLTTTTVLIYFAAAFFFDLLAFPNIEFLELRPLVGNYLIPFTASIFWAGIAWTYLYAEARKEPPNRLWYVVPFLYGVIGGLVAYDQVKDDNPDMASKLLAFGMTWSLIPVLTGIALFLPIDLRNVRADLDIQIVIILLFMLPLILLEIAGCILWLRTRIGEIHLDEYDANEG